MYSPRSVSTTFIPAASIAWSSADSSETIDFDLMIFFTACFAAISTTSALTSAGVSAQRTVAPRAAALRSNVSSQTSSSSSARLRIALAASRVPSKSSSSTSDSRRLATNLPCIFFRLNCRRSSLSLTCAVSLKCIEATFIGRPSRSAPRRRAAPWSSCRRGGATGPRCSACSRDRPARRRPPSCRRRLRTCCPQDEPRFRRT